MSKRERWKERERERERMIKEEEKHKQQVLPRTVCHFLLRHPPPHTHTHTHTLTFKENRRAVEREGGRWRIRFPSCPHPGGESLSEQSGAGVEGS